MPHVKLTDLMNNGMMFMLEKVKGVRDDEEIVVPQIGRMTFQQLKKNVEGKAIDLANKIKSGQYDKIEDNQLEIFSHLVRVAKAYNQGTKVPLTTMFRKS